MRSALAIVGPAKSLYIMRGTTRLAGPIAGHSNAIAALPDFLWVDGLQLARAFLDGGSALLMLRGMQRTDSPSASRVVAGDDNLATIISHPIAQGLCGAIDAAKDRIDQDGPAFDAYCRAAATMNRLHWPMPISGLIAAYRNAGGPGLRGKNGGADDE